MHSDRTPSDDVQKTPSFVTDQERDAEADTGLPLAHGQKDASGNLMARAAASYALKSEDDPLERVEVPSTDRFPLPKSF